MNKGLQQFAVNVTLDVFKPFEYPKTPLSASRGVF
jgi:hypothetical protein